MYGTIFKMKVRSGQVEAVEKLMEEWERERQPKVKGAVAALLLRPDTNPGELVGVAVFQDRAAYSANADAPEQDEWFRRLRELLQSDPEWTDGEFVMSSFS